VLVVEDHGAAREVLMDFLRSLGHTPVAAADGVAMWIAIAAGKFDAVVLDVNLPDADGLKLAGELVRRRSPGAGPRLIGCSADARPETRVAALAAGMDAFCVKPVNRATLAAALGGLSEGRDLFTLIRTDDVAGAARLRTRAELPAECAAIRRAADACDWDEVRRRAHHLRNSALVLGESALATAARSVEEAAARADAPATRRTLEELPGLGASNQASSPALQNARG
jgi:CheY-like chemotaxis protein